jgi:hypothetical protein
VGYVLTSEELAKFRAVANHSWGCSTSDGPAEELASDVLRMLDHAAGLDSKRLHELATWAREQARAKSKMARSGDTLRADAAPGSNLIDSLCCTLAETSRVIEISTDVLTALALDKLPPGVVLNIERDEGQVNAKSPRFRWPSEAERAASMGPVGMTLRIDASAAGDECHLCQAAIADEDAATCTNAGRPRRAALEVEPAANGKMSREQFEALPSHDRVVLGQILATLRAEPLTREPLDGPAVDVLIELDAYLRSLAVAMQLDPDTDAPGLVRMAAQWVGVAQNVRGEVAQRDEWIRDIAGHLGLDRHRVRYSEVIDAAEAAGEAAANPAPRYSLPASHPLRQYQWAEWLGALIRREEAVEGSDYITGSDERLPVLREALARVQSHDVNGLRGLYAGSGEFWPDENVLLQVALGIRGSEIAMNEGGGALTRGCHRVPRVRGETVEVGK